MPIKNTAALNALKALSTGGSSGLDSYRQAQMSEQSSRTSALNNALGGQDVATAVANAQAKYAPKVDTSGIGVDALGGAADSFLSEAANKLSAQNYEDQASLTLKAEKLRRAEAERNQPKPEDIENMLLGAADAMAAEQREGLSADPVTQLAQRKAALRQQLTDFDKTQLEGVPTVEGAQFLVPEGPLREAAIARAQALQEQRGNILREMAGVDEQFKGAAEGYTGRLGTDAAGLLQRYQTENPAEVQDMVEFLSPRQAQAERAIDVGEQGRLRELAPMFGIDSNRAAGMFREGEGTALKRTGALNAEEDYVAGKVSQKEQDAATAEALDMDADTFSAVRKSTRLQAPEIANVMASDNWQEISDLTTAYAANGGELDENGEPINTGVEGYRAFVKKSVDAATHADGTALDDKEKQALINLATAYYIPSLKQSFGTGEAE
jgi:hypothetical protein